MFGRSWDNACGADSESALSLARADRNDLSFSSANLYPSRRSVENTGVVTQAKSNPRNDLFFNRTFIIPLLKMLTFVSEADAVDTAIKFEIPS